MPSGFFLGSLETKERLGELGVLLLYLRAEDAASHFESALAQIANL